MKKRFLSMILAATILGSSMNANAIFFHYRFWSVAVFDWSGALGRALEGAIKYFLSDDTSTIAKLVWDDSAAGVVGGGGSGAGGAGGVYGGAPDVSTGRTVALKAVASELTEVPVEASAYSAETKVQGTSANCLAQQRIQSIVDERASLDQLSEDSWVVQYRAQQRSIQALTDALTMKKAYDDLKNIAASTRGGYGDYSTAVSTVASKRLVLDSLMALRKQVIAARVRARAENLELSLEAVPSATDLGCKK